MSAGAVYLTDRQIEELLRARSVDPDPSLLGEILRAARDVPQRPAGWGVLPLPRRTVVVLAAALLTALLVGGALAVGAGLLRLPWQDDDRFDPNAFALAGPIYQCEDSLPDGVLMSVRRDGPEWTELTATEDGRLITGPPGDSGKSLDAAWSQRRLTSGGVLHLLEAVTDPLPNCQTFAFDGFIQIQARSGLDVYSTVIGGSGVDSGDLRVTSAAEAAAVSALARRLRDPDLGLSGSDWADDGWHPYVPERWRFSVRFDEFPFLDLDTQLSPSDGIVLPDGSTLSTFGVAESLEPGTAYTMVRCAVTGATEARAIADLLTIGGGRVWETGDAWLFSHTEGRGNRVRVDVQGLLPHEDCPSFYPPPESPAPEGESARLPDACDYISTALGPTATATPRPDPEHSVDWALCGGRAGLSIFASRRPVPRERAAQQARSLFGDIGFNAGQIAGHEIFFNGCEDGDTECADAVAISVEPHFVVVIRSGVREAVLRQMAERLIDALDAAN